MKEGHVVCRMLGYKRAGSVSCCSKYSAVRSGRIWLDDVECQGTEDTLAKCTHAKWGRNNCNLNELAGVVCHTDNPPVRSSGKKIFIRILLVIPEAATSINFKL